MPRAVLYDSVGGPDVLYVGEVETPPLGAGEVRVRVKAAGLNPVDAKTRSGLIPAPPGAPFPRGTGSDFAGVVVAAGPEATYWDGAPVAAGDEVMGWTTGASLREELVVPDTDLARKPVGLQFEAAGALSTAGLTALAGLRLLDIGPEDTVLVSAAAGGVGMVYSQLAIARGAAVVGTASRSNHEFLRSIGVVPVEYGQGLADRVRAVQPAPITAVQDGVGRETVLAGLELGVDPERICTIVDYPAIEEFGIRTTGRYERRPEDLLEVAEQVERGDVRIRIERVFPLEQVVEAYALLAGRHLAGKIVVTP